MQPLDVAVIGPFKRQLSVAQNDWLLNHPGRAISIHELACIVTPAYNVTYTARNMLAGFAAPGIYPFSRNAFSDDDFECTEVTNRPPPKSSISESTQPEDDHKTDCVTSDNEQEFIDITASASRSLLTPVTNLQLQTANLPASSASESLTVPASVLATCSLQDILYESSAAAVNTSSLTPSDSLPVNLTVLEALIVLVDCVSSLSRSEITTSLTSPITTRNRATVKNTITPEQVRPFLKALPREATSKGRKKGKSRILTDTP